jgi:hypothetical protein
MLSAGRWRAQATAKRRFRGSSARFAWGRRTGSSSSTADTRRVVRVGRPRCSRGTNARSTPIRRSPCAGRRSSARSSPAKAADRGRIIRGVNRTRAWLVVSPVVATGVLVAHALAYRLTSTPTDPFHEYLSHAPQVLLLLTLSGLVLAGLGSRREAPPAWVFPVLALVTFVAQEHVERLVHSGGVPVIVTTPVFLVGLALQIPVALIAWVLARRLLDVSSADAARPSLRPRLEFLLASVELGHVAAIPRPTPLSRGPPLPVPAR